MKDEGHKGIINEKTGAGKQTGPHGVKMGSLAWGMAQTTRTDINE